MARTGGRLRWTSIGVTAVVLAGGGLVAARADDRTDPARHAAQAPAPAAAVATERAPAPAAAVATERAPAPASTGRTTPARAAARKPGTRERTGAILNARAAVRDNGDAVLAAKGEKYRSRSVVVDRDGATHVRFDRTYRNLEVLGGDYVVHAARGGAFTGATVAQVAPITVSTEPTVDRGRAVAVGQAAFTGRRRSTTADLVVDAAAGTPVLAWRVVVEGRSTAGLPSRLAVIVDATTAAVRRSYDEVHTADAGKGHGLHVGDVALGTTRNGDGSFELTDPGRGGGVTRDALNKREFYPATDPSRPFVDADDEWGDGTMSDRATLAVDVHHGIAQTWDYYRRQHGRDGIRDDGKGATAYVHNDVDDDNAAWIDSCFCMLFGDGKAPGKPFTSLDIVAHEMTHGVTSATANLNYWGESGALNEATSDIFGTLVEFDANNPADPADYLIGEKTETAGPGRPLRYLDDPRKDGTSASCWSPTVKTMDVHDSSGVGNKFFYNLAVGSGPSSWGNSPTCNGAPPVAGIGNDKAGRIWYRALTVYLVSNSNYAAARAATVRAAADLYGTGSPEQQAVTAAWLAAGVDGTDPVPPTPTAPVVTPPDDLVTMLGEPVSLQIRATDPQHDPLTFTATELPAGLSISRSGLVTGKPTEKGLFYAQFTATDPAGNTDTAGALWRIKGPPTAEVPGAQSLSVGTQARFSIEATDYPDTWPESGVTVVATGLPAGMALLSEVGSYVGTVSGTPTTVGTGTAVFTVTDADRQSITVSVPWRVGPPQRPGKPWGMFVTGGDGTALVEWDEPYPPVVPVTGYKIRITPGKEVTATASARSVTFTGLDRNKSYTVGVRATSANGDGPEAVSKLTKTTLPLTSTATSIVSGRAVTLRGQVIRGGVGPIAGAPFVLQQRRAGQKTWSRVAAMSTDRTGAWSRAVKPTVNTAYRVTFAGSYGMFAAVSSIRTIAVKHAVTVKASTTTPKAGRKITISGVEKPARAGVKMTLQRLVGKKWVTVTTTRSAATGKYAFSASFRKGTWRVRVVAAGSTLNAAGTSATVKLTVR